MNRNDAIISGVSEEQNSAVVKTYKFSQNYPNPFNPVTNIKFQIPDANVVSLTIYNTNGQIIRTLVSESLSPAYYTYQWDGTNDSGVKVTSGVYIYRIQAGKFNAIKKMILLK